MTPTPTRRSSLAALLAVAALTAACSSPSTAAAPVATSTAPAATTATAPNPAPPHLMLIVEENHSADQVIGNPAMPFFNSLARTYGQATSSTGVSHPSEPNYLAMISGSIWDNPHDHTPQQGTYGGQTVVDQLAAKGVGWKAYLEDLSHPCDLTDTYGPNGYDVNHNPFMYFDSIRNSAQQCSRTVPFTQFGTDLNGGTAPPFIYVAPNTTNDMHDGTPAQGDAWLAEQFQTIFASTWYREAGTVVITFDEGETSELIATVVVSEATRGAAPLTSPVNHYGLLRGIEETYGLPLLGAAADPGNGDLKPLLSR